MRSALDLAHNLQATVATLLLCTADKRLSRASQAEGLPIFDPETETLAHLHHLLGIALPP